MRKEFKDKIYTITLLEENLEVEVIKIDDFLAFIERKIIKNLNRT